MDIEDFLLSNNVKNLSDKKMEQLIKLLYNLTTIEFYDLQYNEVTLSKVIDEFIDIYKDKNFRHLYSILNEFIDNIFRDERDVLQENLMYLLNKSRYDNLFDENVSNKFRKLYDHIRLTIIDLSHLAALEYKYKKVSYFYQKTDSSYQKTINALAESKNDVNRLDDKVNGYHSQSIEILGIFSALVLGFSTGIDIIKGSFDNITSLNYYQILVLCAFVGLVLFDVMFLLLNCVAKISGHSIRTNCKHIECTECNEKCFIKSFKKYPYVVAFNLLMITFII